MKPVGRYKTVCGGGEAGQEECPVDIPPAERGCHEWQPLALQAKQDCAALQAADEQTGIVCIHRVSCIGLPASCPDLLRSYLIVCAESAPVMAGDQVDGLLGCIDIRAQNKVGAGSVELFFSIAVVGGYDDPAPVTKLL